MKNTLRLALAVLFCIVLCLGAGADAWAENCTITFNPNGGYGSMEPQIVTDGGTVTLKANAYYRTNYIFTGWNTKADGSGSFYADREFINIYNFGQTVTLYAQWATAVVFDKNNDNATGTMGPQQFTLGTPFTLHANEFSLTNHKFDRWSEKPDGTGKSWADMGDYYADTSRTLYAQWVKTHYAVNYDKNGGGGSMSSTNALKNTLATVKWNEFNAPNSSMIFAAWNTKPDGTGTSYLPGDNIGSDDIPSDITLYAVWKKAVHVYFYPGAGSGSFQVQDVPEGITAELNTYSSMGYTAPAGQRFAYWEDENGNKYFNGQKVALNQDIKLTAIWGDSIEFIYNANGGTITKDEKTGTALKTTIAKDKDYQLYTSENDLHLKRSGYRFLGWALGAGADMPKTGWEVENEPISVAFPSDTTLYAVWEQLDFEGIVTITGSVSDMAEKGLVGETLTADVNGEKTFFDYRFQWLRDGVEIAGAIGQTYTVTPDDFEHRITCRVTAEDAKGEKTKLSINYKNIELDAYEKEIDIVDNLPEDEDDYLRGLTNGMKYSFNSTDPKDREYVDDKLITINGVKAFPFFKQGTYRFYDTEGTKEQGPLIAVVEVRNWWSLSYNVTNRVTSSSSSSSSSSSYSSGSGTVRMYNGGTQLTATSKIVDKSGNVIIQGAGINSWLVREGANTDLKVVVTPSIGSYGHVSLNGGDYSSSVGERTIPVSPITEPMRFEIVFSREASYPPVPVAAIDEQNFPDPVFRQYVSTNVDRDGDGMLYDSEISIISYVSVSNMGIGSLKGIEYFNKLQTLHCENNSLSELELNGFPSLTAVYLNNNALTSLSLGDCPNLTTLYCADNALAELNTNACSALTVLDCSNNLLAELDLSRNPQLRTLNCYDNLLGSLELGNNPALSSLYCQGNLLTELDLNGKTALTSLNCYGNLLSWLDVSGCVRLRTLNCDGNELAALDLSGCEALSTLNCYGNRLSLLNLSECAALRRLSCTNNSLTTLDLSGYNLLTELTCQGNELTNLYVNNCPALKTLTCQRNKLTELDLSGCDALLTLMQNVDPVIMGGVVSYGVNYTSSAILSYDEGVLQYANPTPDLTLPAALTAIGSEAFAGGSFACVSIPAGVTSIAPDAFGNRTGLTIIGVPGSAAEDFARAHGFDFVPAA